MLGLSGRAAMRLAVRWALLLAASALLLFALHWEVAESVIALAGNFLGSQVL